MYLRRHWTAFTDALVTVNPLWMVGAVVWALIRRLMGGIRWHLIAHTDDDEGLVTAWTAMRIYFLSNLAIYLPGGIWHLASRAHTTRGLGVSTARAVGSVVFETMLIVWSGLAIGLPSLAMVVAIPAVMLAGGVVIVLGAVVPLFHPRLYASIIGRINRLSGCRRIMGEYRWRRTAAGILLSLALWAAWGLSAFCIVRSTAPDASWGLLPHITSALALAAVIGFLAPWAPSGLGVREGVLFVLLEPVIPATTVVLIMLVLRMLGAGENLFWAGVASVFRGRRSERPAGGLCGEDTMK
jgi:hypothetical protein